MSLKLFRLDETRHWLQFAKEDILSAEVLLKTSPPLIKTALFHCQQAVEKSLKAFLVLHEQPFRKIHQLSPLAKLCTAIDPTLARIVAPARRLTRYAVEMRYPGEAEEPTIEEAQKWLAVARDVLAAVAERVPAAEKGDLSHGK